MTDKQQIAILRKALVDVVQKLGEMPGWRKVENGLPPLDAENCCMDEADFGRYSNPVIVFEEDEAVITAAVYDAMKDEWSDARNGGQFFGVTHWQPLPAAPFDSSPTLAETIQAICASALGDIEVGE